jgi:hypothetical protein
LYIEELSYMAPAIEFLPPRMLGGMLEVGEARPLAKLEAVDVFGAVLSPASKCPRDVRGVTMPLSLGPVGDFKASIDSGLMF